MAVPAQIAILLALDGGLFASVPLDQMIDAERAVREAAATIPADVCQRFDTARALDDADRETVITIARAALARFHPPIEDRA